uniref:hypothetical protein n=1 Tax=Actinoplanes sp. CA-151224 TaxID=3239904 RepID=UPI003F4964F3
MAGGGRLAVDPSDRRCRLGETDVLRLLLLKGSDLSFCFREAGVRVQVDPVEGSFLCQLEQAQFREAQAFWPVVTVRIFGHQDDSSSR